jgi:hypothetical protein
MGPASAAGGCDALMAEIDAKIRAGGVNDFNLAAVDAADSALAGKVVGSCELGTKKIVYSRPGPPAAPAGPAGPRREPILTECKDGSVTVGGDCRK